MAARKLEIRGDLENAYADVFTPEAVAALEAAALDVKLPWYIDLLNVTLETRDLAEAKRRIQLLTETFRKDGTRITENLDFGVERPG